MGSKIHWAHEKCKFVVNYTWQVNGRDHTAARYICTAGATIRGDPCDHSFAPTGISTFVLHLLVHHGLTEENVRKQL